MTKEQVEELERAILQLTDSNGEPMYDPTDGKMIARIIAGGTTGLMKLVEGIAPAYPWEREVTNGPRTT